MSTPTLTPPPSPSLHVIGTELLQKTLNFLHTCKFSDVSHLINEIFTSVKPITIVPPVVPVEQVVPVEPEPPKAA